MWRFAIRAQGCCAHVSTVFLYWVKWLGGSFERTVPMARQQIERLDFADRSRMTYLRMDQEAGSILGAGFYFWFYESCHRMAAAIARTVADVIRPPDHFFGSYATAASFRPAELRLAWGGVMAGIAGVGAVL